ncbi:CoA transferase [Aquabacterium soli]|uniref:CoA transferase n=1 Tax=Aquabacterium soli TaxID=2493092 RepID=A0A3R8YNS5_9BURK|nr:CaiB/BaiF CoA-transferase family protein [Aquabacterium soli]RRS04608.1 CoA transferase [Aquabacterium soli]
MSSGTPSAASPLAGLRVVDLTRNLPGPFATRILADLGATVIKVEPPEGDPARGLPPLYAALNPGKDVRTIDFKQQADKDRLRVWIQDADVLVEGFRPGVMAAMGLDIDSLKALNPKLVVCSITGYGQEGPWAQKAGHDMNFMAMSGALDQMRGPDGSVTLSNIQWGDLAGGSSMACVALLAALWQVQRTGRGCHIDISMTHGLWAHQVMPLATGAMLKPLLERLPGAREDMLNGALPCYSLYTTADGRSLAVGALELKFWRLCCEAWGRPDWMERHWQRGLLPNSPDSNALRDEVAKLIAAQPLSHWADVFDKVDACVTPVLTLAEAQAHGLFAGAGRAPWVISA